MLVSRRLFPPLITLAVLVALPAIAGSFQDDQLRYPRVREAKAAADGALEALFAEKGVAYPPSAIYLRHFKHEGELEVWARGPSPSFTLIQTLKVCARSGEAGPKRQQGDGQVPEGFYYIDRFNPASSYHLSLGVNYPNDADRILGKKGQLGGDIFIHGDCVTIGCIPIEDGPIEVVYWLAVRARDGGQRKIPVHIFPRRMGAEGMAALKAERGDDPALTKLWSELGAGYAHFEAERTLPTITVAADGAYQVR